MLESLKEYFSSIVNTSVNRISNPVFGAFAISWCAFNWKSILYLFLSDYGVFDKINYISTNSDWKTVIIYPCLSVLALCGGLPWVNNMISKWQAKPLDNNDSIENFRKAKRILRATRLQRLQAKHDVTYDKVKTGAEKDIQSMKEQITESQSRMGELTKERDSLLSDLAIIKNDNKNLKSELSKIKKDLGDTVSHSKVLEQENSELKVILAMHGNNSPPPASILQSLTTTGKTLADQEINNFRPKSITLKSQSKG